MAAARVYHNGRVPPWSSMAAWSALSLLPDADVVGFPLGVLYGDPWGHRGATHSLTMSLAVGLAVGLTARGLRRRFGWTGLIATAVLASHAILDTMTDGGLGCALLWPFDLTRYFAPWRPLPVAPIGLFFLSLNGAIVAVTELVFFGPLWVLAVWPRKGELRSGTMTIGAVLTALWAASLWLISSSNAARDEIVGFFLREDTAYASGFSEEVFRTITAGESDEEVRRLIGPPVRETWLYPPEDAPSTPAAERAVASLPRGCLILSFENGVVSKTFDVDVCKNLGVEAGMSTNDVKGRLGSPSESCWQYTWSPREGLFRLRMVCFMGRRVATLFRRWEK